MTGYPLVPALYLMFGAALAAVSALSVHDRSREAIRDSVLPHLATSTAG
jgi:hypothetical protein